MVSLITVGGEAGAVRGAVCLVAVVLDREVGGEVGEGGVDLVGRGWFEG